MTDDPQTGDFLRPIFIPSGAIQYQPMPGDEWQRLFAREGRGAMEDALRTLINEHDYACRNQEDASIGQIPIFHTISDFLERGIERARERLEELKT